MAWAPISERSDLMGHVRVCVMSKNDDSFDSLRPSHFLIVFGLYPCLRTISSPTCPPEIDKKYLLQFGHYFSSMSDFSLPLG